MFSTLIVLLYNALHILKSILKWFLYKPQTRFEEWFSHGSLNWSSNYVFESCLVKHRCCSSHKWFDFLKLHYATVTQQNEYLITVGSRSMAAGHYQWVVGSRSLSVDCWQHVTVNGSLTACYCQWIVGNRLLSVGRWQQVTG